MFTHRDETIIKNIGNSCDESPCKYSISNKLTLRIFTNQNINNLGKSAVALVSRLNIVRQINCDSVKKYVINVKKYRGCTQPFILISN